MTAAALSSVRRNPAVTAALVVAAGSAATLLGAWFFQYVLAIAPCPLCLDQRIVHYAAVPLAALIALAAARRAPRPLVIAGLVLLALAMLFNAGFGVYHAGVEWKWWPGPPDCSGPLESLGARRLLEQLQNISIVRCDEASFRLFGLSLAGYNALISLALAIVALRGIAATRRS